MVNFEQLPDEMISLIIEHMSLANKERFSLVNKAMHALAVSSHHTYLQSARRLRSSFCELSARNRPSLSPSIRQTGKRTASTASSKKFLWIL